MILINVVSLASSIFKSGILSHKEDSLDAIYRKMNEPEKALYYRKKAAEILGFNYKELQNFESMLENRFPNDETAGE